MLLRGVDTITWLGCAEWLLSWQELQDVRKALVLVAVELFALRAAMGNTCRVRRALRVDEIETAADVRQQALSDHACESSLHDA